MSRDSVLYTGMIVNREETVVGDHHVDVVDVTSTHFVNTNHFFFKGHYFFCISTCARYKIMVC